ncbi:MAG: acetate kinase [Candidatus Cloacimonadota bacterium]|nr:MAG: acetate kinase [Candidatus Cloacimonadota bacterium]PIE77415.1 MAG: acetate kinase [Candidatus Delongbacteria bacterium]
MNVLVINCGSSSLKYQLLKMDASEKILGIGLVDKIGIAGSNIKHKDENGKKSSFSREIPDHQKAIEYVFEILTSEDYGCVSSLEEIEAVGHRVAHGGECFAKSAYLNEESIKKIEDLCVLAPLHNPANLKGIYAIKNILPNVPQVAVFDTTFHQTMPAYAYMYALPYSLYEELKIRRYGFHGTSHRFVAEEAAKSLGKDAKDMKIITCHLGNGASICAVKNGKSIDTSMGFTPVEGLLMGTRAGNLDLGALIYVMQKKGLNVEEANALINKKSGLLGISEVSSDMRDVEEAAWNEKNEKAQLALDMFSYRVKKYIGAYSAAMGGVDLIVFTGGIGENGPEVREDICKGFEYLGVEFSKEKNDGLRGKVQLISTENSRTKVMVFPTNEELVIAKDTKEIVNNL